jgi:hypothetical protein
MSVIRTPMHWKHKVGNEFGADALRFGLCAAPDTRERVVPELLYILATKYYDY